jgi:hypothetical protein
MHLLPVLNVPWLGFAIQVQYGPAGKEKLRLVSHCVNASEVSFISLNGLEIINFL